MITLYTGNDNFIQLTGLVDIQTGDFDNTATVTATLYDSRQNVIATLPLAYVAASDGIYEGTLPAATAIQAGKTYRLDILAVGALTALWQLPAACKQRSS